MGWVARCLQVARDTMVIDKRSLDYFLRRLATTRTFPYYATHHPPQQGPQESPPYHSIKTLSRFDHDRQIACATQDPLVTEEEAATPAELSRCRRKLSTLAYRP
jgi:hypothetical protein